jgi:D-proline reductase (dithiol) PrdB
MVKLSELPAHFRDGHLNMDLPTFDGAPWVDGPPLAERRVAAISTAGLHRRGNIPSADYDPGYRIIPGNANMGDLVMSHLSTSFDRAGFYRGVNTVLPIDRLRELQAGGTIGAVAERHYSFMGDRRLAVGRDDARRDARRRARLGDGERRSGDRRMAANAMVPTHQRHRTRHG